MRTRTTDDHTRYGIAFARQVLPTCRDLDARRAVLAAVLKAIGRADPRNLETRRDVAVLRRYLDLLNAGDRLARLRAGTPGAPSVRPADAAAAFAERLRRMPDEDVLYCRVAYQCEDGPGAEARRERIEEELIRRPWLCEMPEDAGEYDPALY